MGQAVTLWNDMTVNTWSTLGLLQTILYTINHSDHEKSKIDITYSPHYAETIYISVHKDSFIPCFFFNYHSRDTVDVHLLLTRSAGRKEQCGMEANYHV